MKKIIAILVFLSILTTSKAQNILSWSESPISFNVGAAYTELNGDGVGNFDGMVGVAFDVTYRNLYVGYQFSPKQSVYSNAVDGTSFGFNLGVALPFSLNESSVITFCPHASIGDATRYSTSNEHSWNGYTGIGPGIKVGCNFGKFNVGVSITKMFCTDDDGPDGWTTFGATVGVVL